MIRDDVRPLVVARCRTASDVVAALGQARGRGLPVAVRSGGHDFAGRSTTTGLLVDLGDLTGVRLADGLVRVGAGTRLAELYGSLEPLGLTLPAGSGPTVGIGGLTLGGGLGFLGRTWGLTCDRLVAAEVVLADGSVVSCDEREHADLFWALRGGGAAGVGVVTELVFAPVPAPRRIPVSLGWDFRVAAQVVDAWQRWSPDAPDGLAVSLLLSVPAEPYGEPRVTLVGESSGLSEAETADLVGDLVTRVGVGPVAPVVSHDTHPHSRSGFFRQDLPRAVLGDLVEHLAADRRPGGARELDLTPWGGAYNRVPAGATAFPHRGERFLLKHATTERDGGWLRASWETVLPWSSGGVYPNFPDPALADPPRAYWGDNLERLERVKAVHDPDRLLPGLGPRPREKMAP